MLAQAIGAQVPADGDIVRELMPLWDSLKHVEYIFLLEDEFDVTLSEEEMGGIDRLSDAVAAVERNRPDAA